jgi:hypothetical protein
MPKQQRQADCGFEFIRISARYIYHEICHKSAYKDYAMGAAVVESLENPSAPGFNEFIRKKSDYCLLAKTIGYLYI